MRANPILSSESTGSAGRQITCLIHLTGNDILRSRGCRKVPLRGQVLQSVCGMGSHWGRDTWFKCMFFYGCIYVLEGELLAYLKGAFCYCFYRKIHWKSLPVLSSDQMHTLQKACLEGHAWNRWADILPCRDYLAESEKNKGKETFFCAQTKLKAFQFFSTTAASVFQSLAI